MKFHRALIAATALSALASCETMSEEDCARADWYRIGETDGLAGAAVDGFTERADRCLRYGLPADSDAYFEGRERGLRSYCTPASGYERGRAGEVYRGVCPAPLEAAFLEEYGIGRRLFDLSKAHQGAIETYERRVDTLETDRTELRRLRDRLRDDALPDDERARLESEADRRRRDIERAERELPRLAAAIDDAQGRLDDYRAFLTRMNRRW